MDSPVWHQRPFILQGSACVLGGKEIQVTLANGLGGIPQP